MAGLIDVSRSFAKRFKLTINDSRTCVEYVFQAILDELAKGDPVFIKGTGVFKIREMEARTIKNPKTGEPVEVGPSVRVLFTAADKFKDSLKAKRGMISEAEYNAKYNRVDEKEDKVDERADVTE